jgi:hypothetical protein
METYIYGGSYPWQEIQLDSSGAIQWTYTATPFYSSGCVGACYGDFAVDRLSGSSYLVEGFNGGLGARVIKVNSAGAQVGFFPGDNNLGEMWRAAYNNSTDELIIAGGGTSSVYQAGILDTNVSAMYIANVLSASGALHDMCLLALDNTGNFYMSAARSLSDPAFANNSLMKGPTSTLIPLAWNVYSGHAFAEISSTAYVNGGTGAANGFNGIAVSPNYLYTYDGKILKKWNKTIGTVLDSVQVSPLPFEWGGLAVTDCDEIFAGGLGYVYKYDVNLNLIGSITVSDSVYDVRLSPQKRLYVCGAGFVSSFYLLPCEPMSVESDLNETIGFNIIPNPFHTTSTIMIDNNLSLEKLKLVIYDMPGHIVRQIKPAYYKVELSNLPPGIYLLSVEGINAKAVKKLIVY